MGCNRAQQLAAKGCNGCTHGVQPLQEGVQPLQEGVQRLHPIRDLIGEKDRIQIE